MIRLLIADDHNLFREGIKKLIEDEKNITVVGEADDGLTLISKYNEVKPNVILTDISMPNKLGPDAIRIIKKKDKNLGVLFLSQFTGDDYIYMVLNAKGDGLLSKNVMRSELILAINSVAKHEKYFVGKNKKDLENIMKRYTIIKRKDSGKIANELTSKEKEVLILLSKGKMSKEIAEIMMLSPRTIESHRTSIIGKMGLSSFSQLIKFAIEYAQSEEKKHQGF